MSFAVTPLTPFGVMVSPRTPEQDLRDLDTEALRDLFKREHLLCLRGFGPFADADQFSDYCERWGEISLWPFGKVLELVVHDDPKDHIFDHSYVPLHWDGMYRPQVPEYQIFHCVQAPASNKGGRTTFSNTALALANVNDETRSLWAKVTGIYQREMEFYSSKTVSPVIAEHPYNGSAVIRYMEPHNPGDSGFINPPNLKFTGLDAGELEEFHRSLQAALHDPAHYYAHDWNGGDIVISDNFTLLHGREAFAANSPRHLRRVHVLSDPPFENPGLESYE